jgi:Zn-dependent M28 family amino/carboxypeptidase
MNARTLFAATAAAALVSASASFAQDAGSAPVTEDEIRAHIAYLASDDLGGRYPGTAGETATAHYIATQLAGFGFVGGAGEGSVGQGWYQRVPLVELLNLSGNALFRMADGSVLAVPEVAVRGPNGPASLNTVPMVYVGHGVTVDGRVIADVRGKIAVVLLNNRSGDGAMTGPQRQAALIAAGAVATLIVPPDTVTFAALSRAFTTPRMQLAARASAAQAEIVLSGVSAAALFQASGLDLGEARAAAAADDYAGQMLTTTATIRADGTRRAFDSYNVIGKLPGTRTGSGTVMMMGHWDHIGLCRPEGAEDRICNGAVDNASGMAVLIEAGRRLGAGPRPDRDILIVGTTAEEQGLLGAYHLVASPPVPLTDIVVNLNVDTVAIAPRGAAVAMVGRGTTPLESGVDAVATRLGRTIDSDLEANAFIQRQDGWALTQAGVPSIMAGGSFTDMALLEAFLGGDYHGPNDELRDDVPLGGAADDADLHVALVRHFGNVAATPR